MYWNWCIWCDGKCALSKQCVVNLKSSSQPQQKLGTHFLNNAKMTAFVYWYGLLFLIASVYFQECCLLLIAK